MLLRPDFLFLLIYSHLYIYAMQIWIRFWVDGDLGVFSLLSSAAFLFVLWAPFRFFMLSFSSYIIINNYHCCFIFEV